MGGGERSAGIEAKKFVELILQKFVSFLLVVFLAGCAAPGGLKLPGWFPGQPTPTLPIVETALPAGPTETAVLETTAPTAVQEQVLTLWVPPEFDPAADTPAGALLAERLRAFGNLYTGVRVNVRIKAASGPGGILESVAAASGVAPGALPSVVAMSRPDLEVAALKGLLTSLDGASTAVDEADWYAYARQLAMVQGTTFALPFAGDALVVAYRPARVVNPPADWDAIYRLGQPLAFAAGDTQALFVLALYQSLGGDIEDAQRRPVLQPEILSQVFQAIADGEERGIFPSWLVQYETNAQVWQSYRDLRFNALVTWVSSYLTALPPDSSTVTLPAMDETPLTVATGWGWAVTEPEAERRALSIRLAEFLTEGEYMAKWTEAAGYLPTRPSALAAWTNQNLKSALSPVAVTAQARPSMVVLSSLGPVLKESTINILEKKSDPTQAAQSAAERLSIPENR